MPTAQQAKAQFYDWLRKLPPARDEEYMKQRIMEMVNKLQPRDWNQFLASLMSIGQYAAGSGTNIGNMIGNEISKIQKLYPAARQQGGPEHPAGLAGRKPSGDPKVLQLQKEFNRLYKGKYRPIREDGIMGPQTEAAKLIMHRQNRLEQASPIASPIEGLENAQKRELKMRPQDAEALMLQKFQGRFGRLPLNRVPELVQVLKEKAKELHAGGYSPEELSKQFEAFVGRITSDDVKQYIR